MTDNKTVQEETKHKRKVFIGSSSKAKDQAYNIKNILQDLGAQADVWFDVGIFTPSGVLIDTLIERVPQYDAAAFILFTDDALEEKAADGKRYVTRDNVLVEAGLFMGVLGRKSVLLIKDGNVKIPSDFGGITRIEYSLSDRAHKMNEEIRSWYRNVPSHSHAEGNVFLRSRREIHRRNPLDVRLHIRDEDYKHITTVRIMCFCGNVFLDPAYTHIGHINANDIQFSDAFESILKNTNATVELVLTEPNEYNLIDFNTKIAPSRAGDPKGALYSALSTVYHKLYEDRDSPFFLARQNPVRFHFRVINTSIPFAIFNVEYDNDYTEYNHVKVDLYSAAIGDEDDRRSFVIWQDSDPENYQFFVENFKMVFTNKTLCHKPKKKELMAWHKKWEEMQKTEDDE